MAITFHISWASYLPIIAVFIIKIDTCKTWKLNLIDNDHHTHHALWIVKNILQYMYKKHCTVKKHNFPQNSNFTILLQIYFWNYRKKKLFYFSCKFTRKIGKHVILQDKLNIFGAPAARESHFLQDFE